MLLNLLLILYFADRAKLLVICGLMRRRHCLEVSVGHVSRVQNVQKCTVLWSFVPIKC